MPAMIGVVLLFIVPGQAKSPGLDADHNLRRLPLHASNFQAGFFSTLFCPCVICVSTGFSAYRNKKS
jgi:hypothetical protein